MSGPARPVRKLDDRIAQQVETLAGLRADRNGDDATTGVPLDCRFTPAGVDLVEDDEPRNLGGTRLVERRLERLDQLVRQATDETDGIGDDGGFALPEIEPARRRVERGEQLVGSESSGPGPR